MNRISLAFRSFFSLLFGGALSDSVITELGLSRAAAVPAAAPVPVAPRSNPDSAIQILAILQRDSRLIDFLMEDISSYSDDQIGAAVRGLHDQARESLVRYVMLQPVIDGVEGTFVQAGAVDAAAVKFIGNVPAAPPSGGVLRHRGWRAAKVELPPAAGRNANALIAPAEIEVE